MVRYEFNVSSFYEAANVAAVALTNKLSHIAWAKLVRGETYQPSLSLPEAA